MCVDKTGRDTDIPYSGNLSREKTSRFGGKIEFHSGSEGERYVQRHTTMC